MEILALVLYCKVEALPTTYLGLPLGAPKKHQATWDSVIKRSKAANRLAKEISIRRRKWSVE